jgi:hypothetical protein
MLMTEWKLEDALSVERAEGLEQGLELGWGEDVKNLFNHGMSADWIADALGLPLDTVQRYLE